MAKEQTPKMHGSIEKYGVFSSPYLDTFYTVHIFCLISVTEKNLNNQINMAMKKETG